MTARRNSSNKIRYELIPHEALEEIAKVFTIGAEKYDVLDEEGNVIDSGADNWRKGLSYRKTIGSALRHIYKFLKGENYDYDYPQELIDKYGPSLHLANAAWNLMVLITFYKRSISHSNEPNFDDRIK